MVWVGGPCGAAWQFDTLSHITSLPGAPTQHWHRDTAEQLYASLGGSSLLPPHCVTLFLPLVDLTPSLGPPQMLLGSHLPCDVEQRSTLRVPDDGGGVWVTERECSHIVSKPYKAVADAGAAILFDSRLMHRGSAPRHSLIATSEHARTQCPPPACR
jgi:ectoine hydroxylase-related dioxygenase (phytanoyl-CoA dioxygenase family)